MEELVVFSSYVVVKLANGVGIVLEGDLNKGGKSWGISALVLLVIMMVYRPASQIKR